MDKLLKKLIEQQEKKFNSKCKCGKGFNCGVKDGKADCWCFWENAGKTIQNLQHTDCMCKDCLKK